LATVEALREALQPAVGERPDVRAADAPATGALAELELGGSHWFSGPLRTA
jgi:hypothetical protein